MPCWGSIDKEATHSTLKSFYKGLYSNLTQEKITTDFILLEKPHFPGDSSAPFEAVKKSYGEKVLQDQAVREVAMEQEEDVLLLINYMLPQMGKTLGRTVGLMRS